MRCSLPRVLLPVLLAAGVTGACTSSWDDRVDGWKAGKGAGGLEGFGLVDGTYKGDAVLVSATGPECPAGRPGTVSIGDNRLFYAYGPRQNFIAPIGTDGSLRAASGGATLEGRVGGGSLDFNIRAPGCESRYALRWVM